MRIAVTGGSGFIGGHLVDRLVALGHEVVVIDRVRPHRGDVIHRPVDVRDVGALARAMQRCDAVFHLAAVSDVNEVAADPVQALDVNVGGTARVWEAARRAEVGRAVLASTVWVYAAAKAGDEPVDEETPLQPSTTGHIYTTSKIAAEMLVHNEHDLYGQPFTILRYGIPYGPRMRSELVIPRFVRMALDGEPIRVHGDGSQYRNYVHIDDLVDGHVRALESAGENQVFNLEGPEPVSVRRLVEEIQRVLGKPLAVTFSEGRPGDYGGRQVSRAKAGAVLGWDPGVDFHEGIDRYIAWYSAAVADREAVNDQ